MNVRLFSAAIVASTLMSTAQAQSLPIPLSLTIPSVSVPASVLPPIGRLLPALPALPALPVPSLPLPAGLPTVPQLAALPALPNLPVQLGISRTTINLSSLGLPSPLQTADQLSPIALNLSDLTAVGPVPVPHF